jgi:hypothetical protein
MSREREHVRDHPAVRERLRWIAEGVHERVVEAPLVNDRPHLHEECRPRFGEPRPHLQDGLAAFDAEIVGAVVSGGVPHRELLDEPRQQRSKCRLVVDPIHGNLDARVEHVVVGACEGSREGLVRRVAGSERDIEQVVVRRDQPVCRALQQHASTRGRRRLTGGSRDQPVAVKP